MIMVDSSVWIDYFNGVENQQTGFLYSTLGSTPVALGDLILAEVLQGFRKDQDYETAKSLYDDLTVFNLLGKEMVIRCAENFRALRKKGITVRKTADVIIASFCIHKKLPLLFTDKDFRPFVIHMGLIEA